MPRVLAPVSTALAFVAAAVLSAQESPPPLTPAQAPSGPTPMAKVLWEYPTNSGVIGQASSFTLDGRQYVAVQSGWGIDARGMQNRLNAIRPGEFPEVPEGGAVWVFALGD